MLDLQNAEFFGPRPIKNLTMCLSVFRAHESRADPDMCSQWATTNGYGRKMRVRSCPEASRNLFDRTTIYWVFRFLFSQTGRCSTALLGWMTPNILSWCAADTECHILPQLKSSPAQDNASCNDTAEGSHRTLHNCMEMLSGDWKPNVAVRRHHTKGPTKPTPHSWHVPGQHCMKHKNKAWQLTVLQQGWP